MPELGESEIFGLTCTGTEGPPLDVFVVEAPGRRPLVYLIGELDLATWEQAAEALKQVIGASGPHLTIDCSGVGFCDARGLAALARTVAHAREEGGSVIFQGASPHLAKILRIAGVDSDAVSRVRSL